MFRKPAVLIFVAIALAVLAESADAAAYVYSQGRKTIRACSLLLPGAGVAGYRAADYNAGLFAVLDARLDLKPAGWEFVNPLAPTIVTPEIASRYNLPIAGTQYVTKRDPWYWDVAIDEVTLSRLLQFDIVYLSIPRGQMAELTGKQRELLRKLVDSGAQLWIDWGGGNTVPFGTGACAGFFVDEANFEGGSRRSAFVVSRHHPLLSYPFWLEQREINALGAQYASGVVSNGSGDPPFIPVFSPVVGNGAPDALPQVAAGQYGSGHIIMTANNVGADIARANFGGGPAAAAPEDLKFAYNVVAWGSNYTTTYKDASHSSSSSQGPGAPLVQRWQYPVGGTSGAAAVIYKGVVFYTSARGELIAFDGIPQQDLDGDGNPDDGMPDYAGGTSFDKLWEVRIDAGSSGPTVFTWPGGSPFPAGIDVVLVSQPDGSVVGVPAFPTPLGNQGGEHTVTPPLGGNIGIGQTGTPSPTYHNGIIYLYAPDGRLTCFDPLSRDFWQIPHQSVNFGLTPRPMPPTVGWTQDIGTGALDLMAYWSTGTVATAGVTPNDRLMSGIFSVRNEVLQRLGSNIAATRYNNARNFTDDWKLWSETGLAGCTEIGPMASLSPTPGQWTLTVASLPNSMTAVTPVFADYQLTRQLTATPFQNLRPRTIYSPNPQTAPGASVPIWQQDTAPAMGPDGTLYMVGKRGSASQIYALQEYGPRFNIQTGQENVPQQIMDWTVWMDAVSDPVSGVAFFPAIDYTLDLVDSQGGRPLRGFEAVGPPAVTDDAVYVAAMGQEENGGPAMALFCFERKKEFQIRIAEGVNFRDTMGNFLPVRIWQPNPFSVSLLTPLQEAVRVPSSAIDYSRRTITVENFDEGRFLLGGEKRPLVAGVPVTVYVGDVAVQVDNTDFSNLRWYFVPYVTENVPPGAPLTPGNRAVGGISPPSVLGEYVYFGTGDGLVYALRADANPTRGKQVFGAKPNYMTPTEWDAAVKDVVWQEKIGQGQILNPISGAGGLLAAVSDGGIAVFDSPGTLIVDNNRLLEVDGGARAVWSLDATFEQRLHGSDPTTLTGLSTRKTAFSRPSVVRFIEGNNLLVADSGNNRIVRVDRAGQVQQEIREFVDPYNLLDSGEPRTLAGPTDVRTWVVVELDRLTGQPAYVYHYLVTDRDNFRILDLVVRYDQNGRPLPSDPSGSLDSQDRPHVVLNWISSSRSDGRVLRYETAQVFTRPDGSGAVDILAAVSNYGVQDPGTPEATKADPQGGAIVRLDYATLNSSSNPPVWTYLPGVIARASPLVDNNGTLHKLVNPRYFERLRVGPGPADFHSIICDNAGVWEVDLDFKVVWRLLSDNYQNAPIGRGVPLRASSAKVLPSGRMLISNEFTGLGNSGTEFHGEVFEVDRKDTGGNFIPTPTAVLWSAPEVLPGPPPEQVIEGSYRVEQPTFADRR